MNNPWVALIVALLALVGVLVSAYVNYRITVRHGVAQEDLADIVTEREERMKNLEAQNSERLQELKHGFDVELKNLEARLQTELTAERIKALLNEINWKRVHERIMRLKSVGFEMLDIFRELVEKGHDIGDTEIVPKVARALHCHAEFKDLVREAKAEIRDDDYDRLLELHHKLVSVFLDLARTQPERISRKGEINEHIEWLLGEEQHFENLVQQFLQPYR